MKRLLAAAFAALFVAAPAFAQTTPYLEARNQPARCAALLAWYERAKELNGPVTFRTDRYPVQIEGQIAQAFVDADFTPYFGASWTRLTQKQRAAIAKDVDACPAPILNQFAPTIAGVFLKEGAERQTFDQKVDVWVRYSAARDVQLPEVKPFGRPLGPKEAAQRQFERLIHSDAELSVGASYKYATCGSIGPTFTVELDIADDHVVTPEQANDVARRVLTPLARRQCPNDKQIRFTAYVYSRRTAVTETGKLVTPGAETVSLGGIESWLLLMQFNEGGMRPGQASVDKFAGGVQSASVAGLAEYHVALLAPPKVADTSGLPRFNYSVGAAPPGVEGLEDAQLITHIAQRDYPLIYRGWNFDAPETLATSRKIMYALTGALSVPKDAGMMRRRGFFYAAAIYSETCRAALGDRAQAYTQQYQKSLGSNTQYLPYTRLVTEYWTWAAGKTFYLDRDYVSLFVRLEAEEAGEAMALVYAAATENGIGALSGEGVRRLLGDAEGLNRDLKTYLGRIGCEQGKVFLRNWFEMLSPPVKADGVYPMLRTGESWGGTIVDYVVASVPSGVSPALTGLPLDEQRQQVVEVRGQRGPGSLRRYRVGPYSLKLFDQSVAMRLKPVTASEQEFGREMATTAARLLVCEYSVGDGSAKILPYWLSGVPQPTQQQREAADPRIRAAADRCPDQPD